MVQSDDSADVNRARDARTAPRHANRFLKICNLVIKVVEQVEICGSAANALRAPIL